MTDKQAAPTPAPAPQARSPLLPERWDYDGEGWTIDEAARPDMRVAFLPSNATSKRRRELGYLIAAAPELLDALKSLVTCDKNGRFGSPNFPAAIEQARNAIAKAEGRK